MIWLLLHACVSPMSLSDAHHELKRRDLSTTEPFRSPDFVQFYSSLYSLSYSQSCLGQLDFENVLLVINQEEVLEE